MLFLARICRYRKEIKTYELCHQLNFPCSKLDICIWNEDRGKPTLFPQLLIRNNDHSMLTKGTVNEVYVSLEQIILQGYILKASELRV